MIMTIIQKNVEGSWSWVIYYWFLYLMIPNSHFLRRFLLEQTVKIWHSLRNLDKISAITSAWSYGQDKQKWIHCATHTMTSLFLATVSCCLNASEKNTNFSNPRLSQQEIKIRYRESKEVGKYFLLISLLHLPESCHGCSVPAKCN